MTDFRRGTTTRRRGVILPLAFPALLTGGL
jgi:hypothetical protein